MALLGHVGFERSCDGYSVMNSVNALRVSNRNFILVIL